MTRKIAALSALALVLTACGQAEPVYVQPIYDKIGNATCAGGYRMATDDAGEMACTPI